VSTTADAGSIRVVPGLRAALLLALGCCLLYLGAEWAVAGRLGPSLDDGWIYMAFARGFVEGDPFSYPGHEGPVAAVTGPIWCAMLGAAMGVFGAGIAASKLLGAASMLFAVYGVFRLGRAATGDLRLAGLAALLTACTPRLLWGALSGMEASFAAGAVALGLALHLERRAAGWRRWLAAAAVLAAAGWARPEAFVFLPLAALHRGRLDAWPIVGLLLAAYPGYHLLVFGYPLPLPFYAKAQGGSPLALLRHEGLGPAVAAAARSVGLQLASLIAWLPSFLPLLAPGFLLGLRRGCRERSGVPFVALAILVFGLARGALGFQPPSFQQGRYFTALWPLFVVVALYGFDLRRASTAWAVGLLALAGLGFALEPQIGLVFAFDWIPKPFDVGIARAERGMLWVPAAVFAGLALAGLLAAGRGRGLLGRPPAWALALWMLTALGFGAHRHGQGVRDTFELNVALAEVAAREVPEGQLLACHDLGAIAWFVRRPILDVAGLGTPEVARAPRAPGARPDIAAILEARRPRYVCLTEDMAEMVNPGGKTLRGVRAIRPVATIASPHNVTVQGDVYHLVEFVWDE
jgi:hypothetical protein